jgi:transcription initiation factor TFIIE subunit alpha
MDPIDDLLKDPALRAYLHRLVSDEGLTLIERFPREGEHSDEDLAAKTGINLNSVRHTLIPFTKNGLPSIIESKTMKRAG